MITDQISNKKPNQVLIELFIRERILIKQSFIRGRKLNTSTVFITQTYFPVAKNVRLRRSLTNKGASTNRINHSSNINSKNFINVYKVLLQI